MRIGSPTASDGFTHLMNRTWSMSFKSLKKVIQFSLFSSGMGSSQSSFCSLPHKCRIRIFALTVNGPASPRGSYTLLICERIILFVSCWGGKSVVTLFVCKACLFPFGENLILTSKHSWSSHGFHLIPSIFSVDVCGVCTMIVSSCLLICPENIHSLTWNPPLIIAFSMSWLRSRASAMLSLLSMISSM